MKVYSDTLTGSDLRAAAGEARVVLAQCSEIPRARTRAHGWVVFLEGSSSYRSQATGGHAATWDEWGRWMVLLFDLDPDARIGTYDGRDDFIRQTREAIERQDEYVRKFGGRAHPGMTGPWLKAVNV